MFLRHIAYCPTCNNVVTLFTSQTSHVLIYAAFIFTCFMNVRTTKDAIKQYHVYLISPTISTTKALDGLQLLLYLFSLLQFLIYEGRSAKLSSRYMGDGMKRLR
jgi:hypothetical protein